MPRLISQHDVAASLSQPTQQVADARARDEVLIPTTTHTQTHRAARRRTERCHRGRVLCTLRLAQVAFWYQHLRSVPHAHARLPAGMCAMLLQLMGPIRQIAAVRPS